MDYGVLFTPFRIGRMTVKNRIVMAPMGLNDANPDGTMSDDELAYFEERARGGAGMIIIGAQFLTKELAQGSKEGYLESPQVIPQLTNLCQGVQKWGAKIVAQLSCGTGRNAFPNMYGEPPVSSSAIPSFYNPDLICRALTVDEIHTIMSQFATTARLLKDAGFDAIEVHGHAGYLIDQFMSSIWNKRADEYGGPLGNRMRFPVEIVQAIRGAVGPTMPVLFRIACDHRFEGGRGLGESMEMLKILENAGVDAVDLDAGSYETIEYIFPPLYLGDACMEYVCEPARKAVKIPIMNAGNHTPETAVRLIESGNADFVMMGRPLIADPYLPNKLMDGAREDVRPCIRCNWDCIGRIINRLTKASCSVNPFAANERRFVVEETDAPLNVVVVGGGPAAMEAARIAAIKGHRVSLYERDDVLGGQLKSAATPPFKSQLRELVDWYRHELEVLGVNVHLNSPVDVDSRALRNADAIIVATGARPLTPPIPGLEHAVDVISAHVNPERLAGERIVYCGGGLSACDSALETAMQGKQVTIVEMLDEIAANDHFINKAALLPMLAQHHVTVLTGHRVLEIRPDGVRAQTKDGAEVVIPADTVVSAFGMSPASEMAQAIDARYHTRTRIVGDANTVGNVGSAIWAGMYAGLALE